MFSGKFGGTGYKGLDDKDTAPLPTNPPDNLPGAPPRSTRTLTIEVKNGTAKLDRIGPVTVKIDMSQSRRIHLTATMPSRTKGAAPDTDLYTMEAELSSVLAVDHLDGNTEVLALGGVPPVDPPAGKLPKNGVPASDPPRLYVTEEESHSETTKEFITWKLDWIGKGVKTE